jgi:hypothetical protein
VVAESIDSSLVRIRVGEGCPQSNGGGPVGPLCAGVVF